MSVVPRGVLKQAANLGASFLVLPFVACFLAGSLLWGRERVFPVFSETVSLFPGLTGVYLRRAFLIMSLERCGEDAHVSFGTTFSHPSVCMGRGVYIGQFCTIGEVTIEDDVLISSHVSIMNGGRQHGIERLDIPIREQPGEWPHVTIGEDSWIGERAVVMADVGKHCVVAAGAVVTKPVPDYAIVAGVPARLVRFRDEQKPTQAGDGVRELAGIPG
jgi:acetyltransferase-like isoleucine patch superfamily enzyme